jgi:hypothetical protein
VAVDETKPLFLACSCHAQKRVNVDITRQINQNITRSGQTFAEQKDTYWRTGSGNIMVSPSLFTACEVRDAIKTGRQIGQIDADVLVFFLWWSRSQHVESVGRNSPLV